MHKPYSVNITIGKFDITAFLKNNSNIKTYYAILEERTVYLLSNNAIQPHGLLLYSIKNYSTTKNCILVNSKHDS